MTGGLFSVVAGLFASPDNNGVDLKNALLQDTSSKAHHDNGAFQVCKIQAHLLLLSAANAIPGIVLAYFILAMMTKQTEILPSQTAAEDILLDDRPSGLQQLSILWICINALVPFLLPTIVSAWINLTSLKTSPKAGFIPIATASGIAVAAASSKLLQAPHYQLLAALLYGILLIISWCCCYPLWEFKRRVYGVACTHWVLLWAAFHMLLISYLWLVPRLLGAQPMMKVLAAAVVHPLVWMVVAPAARHVTRGLGVTSQLQQVMLLYPIYLVQHTFGWLLLITAAPHIGRIKALVMLLNMCHLATCTLSRSDDMWLLKKIFPPKSVEIALAFEDENQLQLADAAARQAADHLGLWVAGIVVYLSRAKQNASFVGMVVALWPLLWGLLLSRVVTCALGMLIRWRFFAVGYEGHWKGWQMGAVCGGMLLPVTVVVVVTLGFACC